MDPHASALDLAAAIRRRELSPTEAMDASLAAVEAHNGALNAIIWLDEHDARERAAAATTKIAEEGTDDLPPFFGVPLPIKDLYDVAGWPNTLGSTGASDEPVTTTDPVIARLEAAGFVLCGRSNSPEFGTVTATENDRYGVTRNPWDLDRTPGGSSGGAAAAVAGGMFSIAHGSDGGGSIRIPASCTGLVGLKAARGRVNGATVAWEGAATQGVLSRTVADTAAVLDAIASPDPLVWWNAPTPAHPFAESTRQPPVRLRVCVATTSALGLETDPECVLAAERAAATLEAAGHVVVDHVFEAHAEPFIANFVKVVNADVGTNPVDWDKVQPYNVANRAYAEKVTSVDYVAAVHALQEWSRAVNAQWGRDFDVLVTPTMIIQPPMAGQVLREITEAPAHTPLAVLQTVAFTSMFNMNGLPAISLPVHQATDTGLPVGAQIVAGPWQESTLLQVAAQLEQLLPWADRTPGPT